MSDPALVPFVLQADRLLRSWLRTNGHPVPDGWAAFVASVLNAHQRPSEDDQEEPGGDDGYVLAVTYAAAGRMLGKSASTIARLVAERKLDVIGNGSGRRVTAESLHRYVEDEVASHGSRAS